MKPNDSKTLRIFLPGRTLTAVSVILTLLVIVITLLACSAFEFDFWDQSFSRSKFGCCRTVIVITVLAHTATGADAIPQKNRKKLILMPHDISVQVAKFEILIPLQVALQSGRYISNGDFQSIPSFFCSIMQPFYTEKFNRGWRREWTEGSTIDFNQ